MSMHDVDQSNTQVKQKKFIVDANGNIVEAVSSEQTSQVGKRVCSIILWVLAIGFEFVAIFNNLIKIDISPILIMIIALVIDLICVVVASLLWKNANHKTSTNNSNKFFRNYLSCILSVIAFAPFIIVVLVDKESGKIGKITCSIITIIMIGLIIVKYSFM